MSQDHLGLFDTPPDRQHIRLSLVIVGLLSAAFLLILPVRDVEVGETSAFVPAVDGVMFLGELIIATQLFAQAAVFRSRALIVLGTVYAYTALLLIPHALTFPGAFAPNGLIGAGLNTTSWIAMLRRVAFPFAIILYVQLKRTDEAAPPRTERSAAGMIFAGAFTAIILAVAVTILTTIGHDLLPPFLRNRSDFIQQYLAGYESIIFVLLMAAAILLFLRRNSVLDLWLLVTFAGLLIQSLLNMTLQGRFTAGWYWEWAVMLVSHLVVLFALMAESNRLYARLALATAARSRERDARLMSIDAVVAAISHEVGQPLTAVSLQARAALNRLTRAKPDIEMAIKALRATIDAGRRTTDVIKSIRAMFAERPGVTAEVSLNDLVRATCDFLTRELAGEKVSLQLALDEALPPILADGVQMQRVLINLFVNAIESLAATQGRPRRIVVRSSPLGEHDVLLEVFDNGVGISSEAMANLFEGFFTTKATGTGLGLLLCRTIVEAHGGRLWASHGEEYGATFHLQLPRSDLAAR